MAATMHVANVSHKDLMPKNMLFGTAPLFVPQAKTRSKPPKLPPKFEANIGQIGACDIND